MLNLPTNHDLEPGSLIENRYRIESVLGEGATGFVLLAIDTQLNNQQIALKILHPHLLFSAESFGRFRNETRVTMSLNHPNILTTYGLGQDGPRLIYLKMEYLAGRSLESMIADERLSLKNTVLILRDIASALEYAHLAGVVHRDLKPANIIVDEQYRPKVADFGLAQMIQLEARYTGYGDILGTPYYMSPEQLRSEVIDSRCDIYALGILAFEMITGRKPFEANSFLELAQQHFDAPLPEFEAPLWLRELIIKCTAKNRLDRYPTVSTVLEILNEECVVEPLAKKSSLNDVTANKKISLNSLSHKATRKFLGFTLHPDRFFGLGYTRLKISLFLLILTLSPPYWNRAIRWRYATVPLLIEKSLGFEIAPLRLLFRAPLDLRYPDGYFVDHKADNSIRNYYRPLLLLGYDPNVINPNTNTYPMYTMVSSANGETLKLFLHYGGDPNLVDPLGFTSLDHAVRGPDVDKELLEILVNAGANPNASLPNVVPPLAFLLNSGKSNLSKYLIESCGADVNIPTNLELGTLHLAVRTHDTELVSLLLDKGIDLEIRDSSGRTALEYAQKYSEFPKIKEIVKLLEEARRKKGKDN